MNYYVIAAAVVVGTATGAASVYWIHRGVGTGWIVLGAAGVGLGCTMVLTAGALLVAGPDVYLVVHAVYLALVIGLPLAGAIVLAFGRPCSLAIIALCVLSFAAVPVGVYATHIEPFWLRVDVVNLAADGIGEEVRIGVLADLETTSIGSYENYVVDRLIAFRPDMVVIPGDLHSLNSDRIDEWSPQFTDLIQRLTNAVPFVYLVNGHSDTVSDLRRIARGTGARVLDNEIETFELKGNVFHIAGISLHDDAYEPAARRTAERFAAGEFPGVRLLLTHEPDAIKLLHGSSVDLLIAGHTHGGQVAIPLFGPPVTASSVPRHVAAGGLHDLHGTPTYVSTGVGRERGNAPQLRFGVRPSIGIIDLLADG